LAISLSVAYVTIAAIAGAASGSGGGGAYDLGFTSTAYTGGDGADGILILKNSRNGCVVVVA
jgi:hypothetical protein